MILITKDRISKRSYHFPQFIEGILINLILPAIYFFVIQQYGLPDEKMAFATPDSRSYLAAGDSYLGGEFNHSTLYRPFLYPVLLKLLLWSGGVDALWFFQAFLWLASLNLLFYSCKRLFNSWLWAVVISLFLSVNITFITLTGHALTEVLTTLGLSAYLFFVAKNFRKGLTINFLLWSLMIFSLLTVVKPLYYLLVLAILAVILFRWKDFRQRKVVLRVFQVLMPIFFQLGLVFFLHGELAISKIGSATFRTNFIADGYATMNDINLDEARSEIRAFSNNEIYQLVIENKWHFAGSYFQNLISHLNGHPSYVNIPDSKPALSIFMARYNRMVFWLHLIFFPLLIYYFFSKHGRSNCLLVAAVGLPWLLIAFTSGISINQGDRLVLPGLPLCFVLYAVIVHGFRREFNTKENQMLM